MFGLRHVSSKYYQDKSAYASRVIAVSIIVITLVSIIVGIYVSLRAGANRGYQVSCQKKVEGILKSCRFSYSPEHITYRGKTEDDPLGRNNSGYGRHEVFIGDLTTKNGTVISAGYYILYTLSRSLDSTPLNLYSIRKCRLIDELEDL